MNENEKEEIGETVNIGSFVLRHRVDGSWKDEDMRLELRRRVDRPGWVLTSRQWPATGFGETVEIAAEQLACRIEMAAQSFAIRLREETYR